MFECGLFSKFENKRQQKSNGNFNGLQDDCFVTIPQPFSNSSTTF